MIKYIGSKRVLVPTITRVMQGLSNASSVIDLFSGTSRVGHGLKGADFQVISNDLNVYATTLATCYVQADREDVAERAQAIIDHCNQIKGEPGYFTRTFCEEGLFFQPKNGARVDAIRDWIETQDLNQELRAVVLTSLMEAADRVDSTTGVQMAFLKKWAPRAHNDLNMRLPAVLTQAKHGKGRATNMEAQEAARTLSADVAYLDPPYNQHKYLGNYHIWETLVRWDAPEAYGIARKRVDVRERKSDFNAKRRILDALRQVVSDLDVRHLVVSFSNEGHIDREEMVQMLSERGEVFVLEQDFKRYIGAQIGIYNPDGDKVGKVSHLRNKEYLFVVPEKPDDLRLDEG